MNTEFLIQYMLSGKTTNITIGWSRQRGKKHADLTGMFYHASLNKVLIKENQHIWLSDYFSDVNNASAAERMRDMGSLTDSKCAFSKSYMVIAQGNIGLSAWNWVDSEPPIVLSSPSLGVVCGIDIHPKMPLVVIINSSGVIFVWQLAFNLIQSFHTGLKEATCVSLSPLSPHILVGHGTGDVSLLQILENSSETSDIVLVFRHKSLFAATVRSVTWSPHKNALWLGRSDFEVLMMDDSPGNHNLIYRHSKNMGLKVVDALWHPDPKFEGVVSVISERKDESVVDGTFFSVCAF